MKPACLPAARVLNLALAAAVTGLLASGPAQAARGLDVRDLQQLERVSSPVLSPDGSRVVYTRREMSGASSDGSDPGKASTSLWVRGLGAGDTAPKRLTPVGWNVNSPEISADGKTLYFLSAQSGTQQVYAMPLAGGAPRQATHYPLDIGSFKASPDGRRLAVSMEVFPDCGADIDCTVKRLDQRKQARASGVLHDKLFVRHWDTWADGRINQLFVTSPSTGKIPPTTFLVGYNDNGAFYGDVPSKPFGDASEYAWLPDGSGLVFAARTADRRQAWSTNFDLYEKRIGQELKPLTFDARVEKNVSWPGPQGQNRAWDTGPVFNADGSKLYYRAMRRPGFEADRFALMERDMASGATREIAPDWDRSADGIVLSADGRTIYTTAQDLGQHPLFAVDVASGQVRQLVGDGSVSAFGIAGDTLVFTRNTLRSGDQLFATSLSDPSVQRALTPSASEMLGEVAFGDYEQFSFPGWNGQTVHGYVVKPFNYQEGRK